MVQQSFNPYAGYDFDNQIEEQEEEQVAQENNKFFNPYAGYDFDSQQPNGVLRCHALHSLVSKDIQTNNYHPALKFLLLKLSFSIYSPINTLSSFCPL